MAYQPKSYRKFLATGVATAVVATAFAPAASANFTDVNDGVWYEDAVNYGIDNDLFEGFPGGEFRPNANMTRAEAVTVILRALGEEIPEETATSSYPDVAADAWFAPAIEMATEMNIIQGNPDGTFAPNANLTRAAFAEMFYNAFDLQADEDNMIDYTDTVDGAWYEEPIAALSSLGILQGDGDGTFRPNDDIIRSEASVVTHRVLVPSERIGYEEDEVDEDAVEITVENVVEITETGVTVEFDALEEDVENAIVVVTNPLGERVAVEAKDLEEGAEEATFTFVDELDVVEAGTWTVGGAEYDVALSLSRVEPLDRNGVNFELTFNSSIDDLTRSNVTIRDSITRERFGIRSLDHTSGERTAQLEMISNDDGNSMLRELRDYDFTLSLPGIGESTFTYQRPAFAEEARVINYDAEENDITIRFLDDNNNFVTRDLDVGDNYDFEATIGTSATFAYNRSLDIVDTFPIDEDVVITSIDEVELEDGELIITTPDGVEHDATNARLRLNTETEGQATTTNLVADDVDYAKVVFNNSGNVAFIDAYQFDGEILVENVDGDDIEAYGQTENFEDYTFVKDSETISIEDVEVNDVVRFNTEAEVAIVKSGSVTGEIERVYETSAGDQAFDVDGERYILADGAQFVDANGNMQGLNLEQLERFAAAEDDVTFYVNFAENVTFMTGEQEAVVTNNNPAFFTGETVAYSLANSDRLEVTYTNTDEDEVTEELRLSNLETVNGVSVDGESNLDPERTVTGFRFHNSANDNIIPVGDINRLNADGSDTDDAVIVARTVDSDGNNPRFEVIADVSDLFNSGDYSVDEPGTAFNLITDEDGDTIGFGFFDAESNTNDVEVGDRFIRSDGKDFLTSDGTPVFLWNSSGDAGLHGVTTWGDIDNFDTINAGGALVYQGANDRAQYLVIDLAETDVEAEVEYKNALVADYITDRRGNLIQVDAWIEGELQTLDVRGELSYSISTKGVYQFEIDVESGELSGIEVDTPEITQLVNKRDIRLAPGTVDNNARTFEDSQGREYELADGATLYDAKGNTIRTISSFNSLSRLEANNDVTVVFASNSGTRFVEKVIVKRESEDPISVTGVSINQGNQVLNTGETVELTADVTPSDASNSDVSWSSSDDDVATVDADGEVTGVADGTATITVTTDDGGIQDTIEVTVDGTDPSASIDSESGTEVVVNWTDATDVTTTLDSDNVADETVSINTQDAGSVTFAITSDNTLVDGDNFEFTGTDEAGNTATFLATWDGSNWDITLQ